MTEPTSIQVSADSPLAAHSDHASNSGEDGEYEDVAPSFIDYPVHWGRTYHRYNENSYHYPNDEVECARLDYQHRIFNYYFDGRLYFAPLDPDTTRQILDVGTGTGIWCIEMSDLNRFPNAEILGFDLSPIQSTLVPPNVYYHMGDCTVAADWPKSNSTIDFVHVRFMAGSLESYKSLIRTAKSRLTPGRGWLELHELHPKPVCDDGTMPDDWKFKEWEEKLNEAAVNYLEPSRPIRVAENLKRWMETCGFEDVTEIRYKVPLSGWTKGARMKNIGNAVSENWLDGLPGFSYKLFGPAGLEWSRDEIELMMVEVRKALKQKTVHAYMMYHVVYGRRPAASEARNAT